MTNKIRKFNHLTVIDKYVGTVFGDLLMPALEKAMGYDAYDMQVGNVISRLRNLGQYHLVDEIEQAIEEYNGSVTPKPDYLTQDMWGRPIE